MILSSFKILIIFNNASADFVLMSADVLFIQNGHSFEWNEDHITVFLKWMEFRSQTQKPKEEDSFNLESLYIILFNSLTTNTFFFSSTWYKVSSCLFYGSWKKLGILKPMLWEVFLDPRNKNSWLVKQNWY